MLLVTPMLLGGPLCALPAVSRAGFSPVPCRSVAEIPVYPPLEDLPALGGFIGAPCAQCLVPPTPSALLSLDFHGQFD